MRKVDLGQAVQILANIGVITGIVFLVIEIRGNTTATQAQTLQAASTVDQDFLLGIGSDARLTRLWTMYLASPDTLSQEERIQGAYLFSSQMRRLENIFLQHQIGALPEQAWESRRGLFSTLAQSAGYSHFSSSGFSRSSSPEILEYMNGLASEGR